MGKDSRAPRVDRSRSKKSPRTSPATPGQGSILWERVGITRRMKTGRAFHCKRGWSTIRNTSKYTHHSDILKRLCVYSQECTLVLSAEAFIDKERGRAKRERSFGELPVQKLQG